MPAICDSYVSTLTLSLYLFNLLPLPFLDGAQLLDALSELLFVSVSSSSARSSASQDGLDVESGDASRPRVHTVGKERWDAWYARIRRGVQIGLLGVLVVCGVGAVWRSLGLG
jgi:S2P endopeptidase